MNETGQNNTASQTPPRPKRGDLIEITIDDWGDKGRGIGRWGNHLDMHYNCTHEDGAYINVLIDWNQSGAWNDAGGMIFHCDDPGAPHIQEHVLQDFHVPWNCPARI